MKTKKNDFLLTMADLDEQLIEKADPYNDSKTVKAKPGVIRTRALVIVSATALAALLGVVVIKTGMFGIRKPSGEEPIQQEETAKKVTDVPPMTPIPIRDDDPTGQITPTPTPDGWQRVTPAPTTAPVGTGTPAPTDGPESKKIEKRDELNLDELKQCPFYPFLPEKLFQYYEFSEAFSISNADTGKYYVLWFTRGMATMGIRINNASELSDASLRRVSASETERYDITKYEIPYAQTVPQELRKTMDDPIFAAEEFNRDVLLKRIVHHSELNDDKYRVKLSIEEGGFIFDCNFNGMEMYDIFPAFGMNPIPDKTPPTE